MPVIFLEGEIMREEDKTMLNVEHKGFKDLKQNFINKYLLFTERLFNKLSS